MRSTVLHKMLLNKLNATKRLLIFFFFGYYFFIQAINIIRVSGLHRMFNDILLCENSKNVKRSIQRSHIQVNTYN